ELGTSLFTSAAATSPWAISTLVAFPEAETPSYTFPPPCRIRVTISAEVLAYLALTLQPVCCWNGVTQSNLGSFWPLSVYPGHAMRLSWPSVGPMLPYTFTAADPMPLAHPSANRP